MRARYGNRLFSAGFKTGTKRIVNKGKPIERWGRKASGLRAQAYDSGVAGIEGSRHFGLTHAVRVGLTRPMSCAFPEDHQSGDQAHAEEFQALHDRARERRRAERIA